MTPWTVTPLQAPLSTGILQARILQWAARPSSRGSSRPRDQTQVSCIAGKFFTLWALRLYLQAKDLVIGLPSWPVGPQAWIPKVGFKGWDSYKGSEGGFWAFLEAPSFCAGEREKEAWIEQGITQIVYANHLAELLAPSKPSTKVYCHCVIYCYSLTLSHIHQLQTLAKICTLKYLFEISLEVQWALPLQVSQVQSLIRELDPPCSN